MAFNLEIETLRIFVSRSERLLRSRLSQNILSNQLGYTFTWVEGIGSHVEYPDCNEDDRDAFILSLRLFIQNNDRISIYNVSNVIESLPLSESNKQIFQEQRTELNRYLDSPPIFTAAGTPETNRELLNVLVYGEFSHLDSKLRPLFLKWVDDPIVWPHMQTQFLMICQAIILSLSTFETVVKEAIGDLTSEE
jgi:hypothetical protein